MIRTIKNQKNLWLAGLVVTAILSAITYYAEHRLLVRQSIVDTREQLDLIQARLGVAEAEVDATAAYITFTDRAFVNFDDYLQRLSPTSAELVPWFMAVPVQQSEKPDFITAVNRNTGSTSFNVHGSPPATSHMLPVIGLHGPLAKSILGYDLLDQEQISARVGSPDKWQTETTSEVVARLGKNPFADNILWVGRVLQKEARGEVLTSRMRLVMRGIPVEELRLAGKLEAGQGLQLAALTPARPDTAGNGTLNAQSPRWDRIVPFADFNLQLSLDQRPLAGTPKIWVLTAFAGVLVTALLAFFRTTRTVVSEVKSLHAALQSSESMVSQFNRRERIFFDFSGTGNCETAAATGRLLRVNDAFCEMLKYPRAELEGRTFSEISHPDDVEASRAKMQEIATSGQAGQFEKRYLTKTGEVVWALVSTKLFEDSISGEQRYLTSVLNISDRKRTEQQKDELLKELAHRVRNTMQLTSALARQSGTRAVSVKDYDTKFRKRLAALTVAQDLLFEAGWKSANMQKIAKQTSAAFFSDNLKIDLPNVELPTQHAQTFALAIHELASNSGRFGAAANMGNVTLSGTVTSSGGTEPDVMHLIWDENFNRSSDVPHRSGFGRTMLETVLPEQFNGWSKSDWRKDGFTYQAWLKLPA